jgi:hypothetical protein
MDIFNDAYFDDAIENVNYEYAQIDAAYEAGYNQALSDAQEGTGTKRALASALGGPITALIYRAIHRKHAREAAVCSISKLQMNGLSSSEAKKEFDKTVHFLKSKRFVMADNNFSNGVISYNDLTPAGQQFIQGFYDKMDEITEFNIDKAMQAKYNKSAASKQKGWDIVYLVLNIVNAFTGIGIPGLILSAITLSKTDKDIDEALLFERNMY